MTNSRLVYATDQGRIKPEKSALTGTASVTSDGFVRLQKSSKGRGGKEVTVITGLPLAPEALKQLAKELKQACGTGGTLKDCIIEIQGEHREKLKQLLEQKGFKVKMAGG